MKRIPIIIVSLVFYFPLSAQDSTLFKSEKDSIEFFNNLRKELYDLLDSTPYKSDSYFDVNLGVGSAYFTTKNAQVLQNKGQAYYSGGLGYYHQSGLSLSVVNLFATDNSNFTWFQSGISFGYQFIKSRKWGFGISYTRYFNKDSLSFYTSPLVNEWYAFVKYRNAWLQPSLSVSYGYGSTTEVKKRRLGRNRSGEISTTNHVNDLATSFSVQHNFTWKHLFFAKDDLVLSPSIIATAGTNNYGLNTTIGKEPRFFSNKRRDVDLSNSVQGLSTSYQLLSVAAVVDVSYNIGKFYVQPEFLLNYTVPKAFSIWTPIAVLTAGINF